MERREEIWSGGNEERSSYGVYHIVRQEIGSKNAVILKLCKLNSSNTVTPSPIEAQGTLGKRGQKEDKGWTTESRATRLQSSGHATHILTMNLMQLHLPAVHLNKIGPVRSQVLMGVEPKGPGSLPSKEWLRKDCEPWRGIPSAE